MFISSISFLFRKERETLFPFFLDFASWAREINQAFASEVGIGH